MPTRIEPTRRSAPPGAPRTMRGALAACLVLASGLAGCAQHTAAGTDGSLTAAFSGRKLNIDLPGTVRVPAVVAAANEALRARGYTITASEADEARGRVVGEPHGARLLEQVNVGVRADDGATVVSILYEPFGNQKKSRRILDDILGRLGL